MKSSVEFSTIDRLSSRFRVLNNLINAVVERVVPAVTAQAAGCPISCGPWSGCNYDPSSCPTTTMHTSKQRTCMTSYAPLCVYPKQVVQKSCCF